MRTGEDGGRQERKEEDRRGRRETGEEGGGQWRTEKGNERVG